jgi:signal transduction histidine kinase
LERAFDLFYSTRQDGKGLGLSIVEKIVSNHHGTIDIESSKEKGTTVTVSFLEYQE